MKINLSFFKTCSLLFALAFVVTLSGCKDDDTVLVGKSGYVQFKLYRLSDKPAETRANELDYLSTAKKIEVVLQNSNGSRPNVFNRDSSLQLIPNVFIRASSLQLIPNVFSRASSLQLIPKEFTGVSSP